MHLIFGGAYQGKLEYALSLEATSKDASKVYNFKTIAECETPMECIEMLEPAKNIPSNCEIINHFERFTYACADNGKDPVEYLKNNLAFFKDKIIIADDVSQGIVPLDQTERAWREINGRALAYLAKEAKQVTRVFCGIPEKIK